MPFKSVLQGTLLAVSLIALVASPCLVRAQQKTSDHLREQAAKLQQDIEALKNSKAALSGRVSASLFSSLESEIQAKRSALDSAQQKVKQAEGLERDIVDLTVMRDKMQGRVSSDLLGKVNEEVAAKQQALARLSDPVAPGASAPTRMDDPPADPPPATAATPGAPPADSAQEKSTSSTKKGSSHPKKTTESTASGSTRTSPAAASEKPTQPPTPASPPAKAEAPAKAGGAAEQAPAAHGSGSAPAPTTTNTTPPAGTDKKKPGSKPDKAQQVAKQPTTVAPSNPPQTAPAPAGQERAQSAPPPPQGSAAPAEGCTKQPCADQPYEGQTWVTGKITTGGKVTVNVNRGNFVGAVDANGNFRAGPIDPPLVAFQIVSFKAEGATAPTAIAVKTPSTCDSTPATLPCLNQPNEGDMEASGKVKDQSKVDTIKISGEKDKAASESIQIKDSTFKARLSHALSQYDSVEAEQIDSNGNLISTTGPVKVADEPLPAAAAAPEPAPEQQPAFPPVTISPTSLLFPSDKAEAKVVTVRNVEATTPPTITFGFAGENPGDFDFAPAAGTPPGACPSGSTLAKGTACAIYVIFKPTATGQRRAILYVNMAGSVRRVWLQGGGQGTMLNPARFVRIFEDTEGGDHPVPDLKSCNHCIQIYNPDGVKLPPRKTIQLSADEKSGIVVLPDINLMTQGMPLNKLFITAQLVSGANKTNLEVVSYSEVGKDQSTSAAQKGTAFESARDIELKIVNMNNAAEDSLKYAYCSDPMVPRPPGCGPREDLVLSDPATGKPDKYAAKQEGSLRRDVESKAKSANVSSFAQRLKDRLRLHQEEINGFASFFQDNTKLALVQLIGTDALHIDRDSLSAIVKQFKDDSDIVFNDKSTGDAINESLWDILERTKIIYRRFAADRVAIATLAAQYLNDPAAMPLPLCSQESDALAPMLAAAGSAEDRSKTMSSEAAWKTARSCAENYYVAARGAVALAKLTSQIVPGYISLQSAGAKDGDRLTVTVEVKGENDAQGIAVPFEIAIKRYGWKPQVADSFMFVHRQGLTLKDLSGNTNPGNAGLNRVNFAPSPGVTFSLIYLQRGDEWWKKSLRALGPGIGMNVSFMNFNDPSFDQTTGQFTKTTGLNIQEGAGVVGSFFDNKIQFSRGWNLNADRKRQYWAIGFGFIEITKEVAKYVKQK